jgi:hypothetical protein
MRMKTEYEPYKGTQVPIERSQGAIRKIFDTYGIYAHQFSEAPGEQLIEIRWSRKLNIDENGQKRDVLQPCKMRVSYKGRTSQQVWRAIFYHLKAKFEVVRFGIISYEEEFLPYFEIRLPNGQVGTIAEAMVPALQDGRRPDMLALPEARDTTD